MVVARIACLVLSGILFAAGCGSSDPTLPKLHSATGTVTRGGVPVANALVRLATIPPDTKLTITGATDAEGRFELSTFSAAASSRQPGVPAGSYQVTIDLPVAIDQSGGGTARLPAPIAIPASGPLNLALGADGKPAP